MFTSKFSGKNRGIKDSVTSVGSDKGQKSIVSIRENSTTGEKKENQPEKYSRKVYLRNNEEQRNGVSTEQHGITSTKSYRL